MSSGDICVEEPLMGVYFTYLWREKFNENYTTTIKNWIEGEKNPPHYLVMGSNLKSLFLMSNENNTKHFCYSSSSGSTAHHVQEKKDGVLDYNKFEKNITRLARLLDQLSERYGTRIVWWNDDVAPNTFESEESFIQLNDIIRRVFK